MFEAGMITPTKLHYVRSHGPVPALDWNTHRLSITVYTPHEHRNAREGSETLPGSTNSNKVTTVAQDGDCPTRTRHWTMDEIAGGTFPISEFAVTIACDGNRRKEVNMIKRSAGYDWSAAGVSTCVWRGIHIRDILKATGLENSDSEEWFLNLEGADQCSEGTYATSIPLTHAMDTANDVMLAFGMNGRVLHPDHGYPLRIIIPGFVGGRQIKWLKRIWISEEHNMSHYHIWDNKVVPSEIDSKEHPLASAFFHHEDSACYEQILQSVICKPAHDERVPLSSGQGGLEQIYTVEGYAYDGAGSKVQRVELTLDGGKTWRYCSRRLLDAPLRHGVKHWAWAFWSCQVRLSDLVNAEEISCRAFDNKKNTQPEHITWNLMGMMNNSWYRIRPSLITDPETKQSVIHFRHPVAPGPAEGGWMKPNKEDKLASQSDSRSDKTFSLEEIAKHDKQDDAWLILDGKVYDVTSVLSWHPGGANAILSYAGKATVDATNEYKGIHDNYANSKRDKCLIGALSKEGLQAMEKDSERAARALAKIKEERKDFALQPDEFIAAKLIKRREVNTDTR
ncbi:Oxidoreductase, molybdopterin-binding domain-containing protein [Amylocystis lapponica]|nr:Oxidoreductase, molybdopterin-binding domain-containing protein [Amylocystis lapponica]